MKWTKIGYGCDSQMYPICTPDTSKPEGCWNVAIQEPIYSKNTNKILWSSALDLG